MPSREAGAPLEQLREALAARVEATSLRQVAREVQMSPSGLQKVLDGSQPYSATQRKLERWYVRQSAQPGGTLGAESASAALRVLVQDLPPRRRPEVLGRLLETLAEAHRSGGRPLPEWLAALRSAGAE